MFAGKVDCGTGNDCGATTVYKSLCNVGGFWVVKRVMDGVEEKDTANILICFSEWALCAI